MIKEADHREREIALIRRAGVFHGLAVQAQKEFADLAVVVPYAKKAIIYQCGYAQSPSWGLPHLKSKSKSLSSRTVAQNGTESISIPISISIPMLLSPASNLTWVLCITGFINPRSRWQTNGADRQKTVFHPRSRSKRPLNSNRRLFQWMTLIL
jgi:hypothetical protein